MNVPSVRLPRAGLSSLPSTILSPAILTSLIAGSWEIIDQFLPGATPQPWHTTVLRALAVGVITYLIYVLLLAQK